jgi:hypothetical protein
MPKYSETYEPVKSYTHESALNMLITFSLIQYEHICQTYKTHLETCIHHDLFSQHFYPEDTDIMLIPNNSTNLPQYNIHTTNKAMI